MVKVLLSGILGGLLAFAWQAASWTTMPWHNQTIKRFRDENGIVRSVKTFAPQSGVYTYPNIKQKELFRQGPVIFSAIHYGGTDPGLKQELVFGLLAQMLAALLVGWMTYCTDNLSYFGRLTFAMMAYLVAGVICYLPLMIWWKFPVLFIGYAFLDLGVSGALAGLLIAALCQRSPYA